MNSPEKTANDNGSVVVLKLTPENYNKIIFAGVFDGHGTYGHQIAKECSDNVARLVQASLMPTPSELAANTAQKQRR